nr:hypothetical protein [Actinomycetota bacterium]
MKLTFDVRQDIKRFLAIGGVSLAFIVAQGAPALAITNDPDGDGLSTKVENNITYTSPRDANSDNDQVKDGNEDFDEDGVDNTNEFKLYTKLGDDDTDNDGVEDGDEDRDRDGTDNEDEDDLEASADEHAAGVEDEADEDDDVDDLDDEDENDFVEVGLSVEIVVDIDEDGIEAEADADSDND